MKSKLLNIFIITFLVISTLVLTGCNPKEDKAEDTIRGFIEKHYVADEEEVKAYDEYVKNGYGIGDKLTKADKEFAEYLSEKGFEVYRTDGYFYSRLKELYAKNCTLEIENLKITEKEKSEDMRCFNVSFDWIIRNDEEEIVKKHKVDKDMYLSKENGQWLINGYNRFEIIYTDFVMW